MKFVRWMVGGWLLVLAWPAGAQRIVYSEPDRDDSRRMNFEIAGKVGGNFLIYKYTRNRSWISVLDNDMKELAKVEQTYMPNNERLINVDLFPYPEFCYMIYQYERRNVVYCIAAKIDARGNPLGEPLELDTSHIGGSANNKIYTAISSEDKGKLAVFKINSRNRRQYVMTSLLLDDQLRLLKRSRIEIPMEERNDFLGDFALGNAGDLVFSRFLRSSSESITQAWLMVKGPQDDTLSAQPLDLNEIWLDEIHIKVDNFNNRYILTSFCYKERRGNIDGFYFSTWDKNSRRPIVETTTRFGDELRREARGDASAKMAFNDYFIRNIITRRDGGVIIGSESYYTSSRFNNWNRWDYLYGSPFMSPMDYWSFSPYYRNFWWGNRWGSNQALRYHADNIAVFSISPEGQTEWSTVIGKSQFNDETDDVISYSLMNTGGELHFLFNLMERRNNLLSDFSITPAGQLNRNPTLKNLDKGYDFMPKYGKQVSARQLIVPCLYRNYICFAKIDYTLN